jgi:predicted nucleic acid-binding protein
MLAAGHRIYVPEVIDYELRRELIRAGKLSSVRELDNQKSRYVYAPITTDAMLLAADLWARMRNSGTPTGDPKKIDIDVILAAQAQTEAQRLGISSTDVIVATSNVAHISRLATADLWQNIKPYRGRQQKQRPCPRTKVQQSDPTDQARQQHQRRAEQKHRRDQLHHSTVSRGPPRAPESASARASASARTAACKYRRQRKYAFSNRSCACPKPKINT